MPIPFTVIGGFLGAGKTTLLNRVLREARDERVAVLVNDFGAINVDADLVVEHGGETIALANGCICCSIGDSLMDTLIRILSAPQPIDRILVEASGVSDPARIADIAVIDRALSLDGIVVLVDAAEVRDHAEDRFVGDAVRGQLAAADIVVLNKTDLVSARDLDGTEAWVRDLAPGVPCLRATAANVPIDLLYGGTGYARQTPGPSVPFDHEASFARASFVLDTPPDRARFEAAVAALPPSVLRAKGIVRFDADPADAMLLQKTGRRWSLSPVADTAPARDAGRVVFIGTPQMPDEGQLRTLFGVG